MHKAGKKGRHSLQITQMFHQLSFVYEIMEIMGYFYGSSLGMELAIVVERRLDVV